MMTAAATTSAPTAATATAPAPAGGIFSIEGRALKLNSAADAAPFVAEILAVPKLVEVKLSGNTLGVEASKAIAAALKQKADLRVVNMSDIFTGRLKEEIPLALEFFVDAFIDKVNLHTIDLSDNAFGPHGSQPLCRLLIENHHIETIRLNNNGLGTEGAKLLHKAFIDAAVAYTKAHSPNPDAVDPAAATLPTLKSLSLARNRLESGGGSFFAIACERLSELRELRMPQNSIRVEGIENVLRATAKGCKKLEHLDLEDNTFNKEGSIALANALPAWPGIRILNIGDCLLGKEGCELVLKALTGSHGKLESLAMIYNEMELGGAKLIPAMMAGKPNFTSLTLNGNAFSAKADVVVQIRDLFRAAGHIDGLDELDEMDFEEDEEEEEEEEEEEDEDEDVKKSKPKKATENEDEVDDLADMMGKKLNV